MAPLLSLPTELFIEIYKQCSTLHTAASLSGASRGLYAVWLEHINEIAGTILRRQIPEYDQAVELAMLEETLANTAQVSEPHDAQPKPTDKQMSIATFAHRLLRNAELALSATGTSWHKHKARLNAELQKQFKGTSSFSTYYLMRKIFLSRQHPKAGLQQNIYSTLCALSLETLIAHEEFCSFFLGFFREHDEESRLHGIVKSEEDWTDEDYEEWITHFNLPIWEPWGYVLEVVGYAMDDKKKYGEISRVLDDLLDDEPTRWLGDRREDREKRRNVMAQCCIR